MCSGRVDLEFILRAFSNGQDGVLIGGCRLNECNYITHGNYDALSNTHLGKKIMEHIGLNPQRLRIAFMSGADGNLLAEVTNDFTEQVKALGPLGEGEGIDKNELKLNLEAAKKLIPYLKLVEREKLRVPSKSETAYNEFFESSEVQGLFNDVFSNNLAVSRILTLLKEKPLSTRDISEKLGLKPSDVATHMNRSSMHGLVKYDTSSNCYALYSHN
jgi:coenzyme F420-reducing hydrogenase delta subunit